MSYQDPITVSGSLVTFNDPDGDGRITNLSAAISLVQDLNGYDSPWPAGGGVNKLLPMNANYTASPNGLTLTYDLSTESFSITGTNSKTDAAWLVLNSSVFELATIEVGKTYYFSHNLPSTLYSQITYNKSGGGVGTLAYQTGTGSFAYSSFTAPNDYNGNARFQIGCYASTGQVNATGIVFEVSETAPTAWTPYSNICPITGRTGLSVYRTGINVWDEQWEAGQYNSSSSTVIKAPSNNHIRSKNPIPVVPETTYYMQSSGKNVHLIVADADGNVLYRSITLNNGTFTTPTDGVFVYFNMAQAYGTTYNNDISINYPSSDHDYHAYSGNTYAVDWSTPAGTVYGGTIDVATGLLTVDRAYVGLSGRTWTMTTETGGNVFSCNSITDKALNYNFVCNMYKAVAKYRSQLVSGEIGTFNGTNGRNRFSICDNNYSTVESFVASISDLYVCYELATPLTYQLSAQTIQTLLGTNNIWADAGDVTVTYQLVRHGFEGWLIKVGTEQTEIPINFIRYSTYKVTPDQRMEWSAERNVNGFLQRETVPHMPPKIEFNTKLLTNSDVTALMSILNKSFTVASERKLPVYFYDPENNTYKTCDCYMPDIDFKIRNVDTAKNIINYEELRFAFIGY